MDGRVVGVGNVPLCDLTGFHVAVPQPDLFVGVLKVTGTLSGIRVEQRIETQQSVKA